MKTKRTTPTELTLKGLMLFAIFTVIQSIDFFDSINKIWLAVVALALILRLLEYRYTRLQFIMLALTVLIHVIALGFTEFPLVNTNMLFYFLLWVMLYMFFAKSKTKILSVLQNADGYINAVLWGWTLLVGISVFLPSSYVGRYFISFSGSSFRLMMAVLIIMALAMYMSISRKNKFYNFFLILPTYAAFMNQSRTYFLVYICFLTMYMYMVFKSRRTFYLILIPFLFVTFLVMSVSGIMDKMEAKIYTDRSYFDYWGTITSGRSIFWILDLEAFFDLPFWQQFVGNGFNFVYDVNRASFAEIWAHNDIINLLMNFGYIGVLIYLWVFFEMLKSYGFKDIHVPRMVKLLFLLAVSANSMLNMSYTYMCAMISYPFFLCAISAKYEAA